MLKVGDLVRRSDVLDFKGFLLQELKLINNCSQLELDYATRHKLSYRNVLWIKQPYGDEGPVVESQFAPTLEKIKDNGL